MIEYEESKWDKFGITLMLRLKGSVLPNAAMQATPSAALAIFMNMLANDPASETSSVGRVWSGFLFVLGFLVVFRTQLAYSRYWEGATLLGRIRGQWYNATSNLFAFCSPEPSKEKDVIKFQHYVCRLVSLLHCAALQQVADLENERFEILDIDSISEDGLKFLDEHPEERCLIILQWIQRLIMDANRSKTLDVPPPILTRVFQEFGQGIVNVQDAEKLSYIKFPFPYAQMISLMLMAVSIIMPIYAGILMHTWYWGCMLTFASVFSLWAMNDIASEIELPFGDDENDLPVAELQVYMNKLLGILLEKLAQMTPEFSFDGSNQIGKIILGVNMVEAASKSPKPDLRRQERVGEEQATRVVQAQIDPAPTTEIEIPVTEIEIPVPTKDSDEV